MYLKKNDKTEKEWATSPPYQPMSYALKGLQSQDKQVSKRSNTPNEPTSI
jgi:hypothetical protein